MFHLITSNRMELLRETLVRLLREPVGGPLDEELIIVPNRGLGRWLEMGLATDHGICAQTRVDFPRRLVRQILDSALGEDPRQDGYQPAAMAWLLYAAIPDMLDRPGFDELRDYWLGNPTAASRFALCGELARIYDLAIVYRPEDVLSWQAGAARTDWTQQLFLAVAEQLGPDAHLAARVQRFLSSDLRPKLPQRVSLFGLGCLPPLFLRLIKEGTSRSQSLVYQLQLSPSDGLFTDAQTQRQQQGLREAHRDRNGEVHLATVHSLLASWGDLAKAQQQQQIDLEAVEERALFASPEGEGTLHRLQRDLRDLTDRYQNPRGSRPPDSDRSLQVHRCHGALREVEVLKDQILDLLSRHQDLQPHQLAVLCTDPAVYFPLIRAIFAPELPVSKADLSRADDDDLAQAVVAALAVAQGALGRDEVLSLLSLSAVQRAWRLEPRQVDDLAKLIEAACIHEAWDDQHRQAMGQAGGSANTWQEGLQRLGLGLAMPDGFNEVFDAHLPVDPQDHELLSTLVGFAQSLGNLQRCLEDCSPVDVGMAALEACLTDLLGPRVQTDLGSVFDDLRQSMAPVGPDHAFATLLFADVICRELQQEDDGSNFLAGGITVGGLTPLRAVPFEAIFVLGLGGEGQGFPRASRGSDLEARVLGARRPGDRDRRQEDLDLFLQLLLSARRELALFVSARSVTDGSELPPSVVVEQILELIAADSDPGLREALVIDHPLQPFDPRAYDYESTGGSFTALYRADPAARPFAWSGASRPQEVDLWSFCAWFRDSLKQSLSEDLGLRLKPQQRGKTESGRQVLTKSERVRLLVELLEDPKKDRQWLLASRRLTPGRSGAIQAEQLLDVVANCPLGPEARAQGSEQLTVHLELGALLLTGSLPRQPLWLDPWTDRLSLRPWIEHLVRQVVVGPQPTQALLNGSGKASGWKLKHYASLDRDAAQSQLERLAELYVQGQEEAWVFVEESLRAFTERRLKKTVPDNKDAWASARAAWVSVRGQPHFRRCLGPDAALPGEGEDWFLRLSKEVFEPARNGEGRS